MHLNCNTFNEKYNIKIDIDCGSKFRAFMSDFVNEFFIKIYIRRNFSETGFPSNLSLVEVQICGAQLFFCFLVLNCDFQAPTVSALRDLTFSHKYLWQYCDHGCDIVSGRY